MPTTRISDEDHRLLQALAADTGKAHHEILHDALDAYQRDALLDGINKGFAKLRRSKNDWAEETAERQAWGMTVSDDIEE